MVDICCDLFNNPGHQEQATLYSRRAALIGVALIGLADDVISQTQGDFFYRIHRMRQRNNAGGIDGTHLFHDAKKIIELNVKSQAFFRLEAQPRKAGEAVDISRGQRHKNFGRNKV